MSNDLYRGPFIDAFYQISVHLTKRLQRKRFLEIDQPETRIACGGHVCERIGTILAIFIGPSIDVSYHVSVHLANLIQSKRFLEIDQPETRIDYGGHVCKPIRTK